MTKKFVHDSKCCQFLGHLFGHDIYVCEHHESASIIARYGNEPYQYQSCPKFAMEGFASAKRKIGIIAENRSEIYAEWVMSEQSGGGSKSLLFGYIWLLENSQTSKR